MVATLREPDLHKPNVRPLMFHTRLLRLVLAFGAVVLFLAAALHDPGRIGARVYAGLLVLTAGFGIGVAGWHVRLQNLPAGEVPGCGRGFEYIMDNFALFDALSIIFKGSGECADVVWRLFGLSMPTWVIIGLGALGVAGIWNNLRS